MVRNAHGPSIAHATVGLRTLALEMGTIRHAARRSGRRLTAAWHAEKIVVWSILPNPEDCSPGGRRLGSARGGRIMVFWFTIRVRLGYCLRDPEVSQ